MMEILIKHRGRGNLPPFKAHHDDAGWDLFCNQDIIVWPKCTVDLDTGLDVKVPAGTWGTIKPRSSTFKRRKLVVFEGVIDPGYTGKLSVLVWNPGFLPRRIKKGERLAQLIVIPLPHTLIRVVEEMPQTSRGNNCFGSTGR